MQVVPRVGRPALMLTVNKQTLKKKEIILSQKSPKKGINCEYKIRIFVAHLMKNLIMKFQCNSAPRFQALNEKLQPLHFIKKI